MHNHAEVYLENLKDWKSQVEEILLPYDENLNTENGLFDWYQIGGRWTGSHGNYDPETDPLNFDEKGKLNWPALWVDHSSNIIAVENVDDELTCATIFFDNTYFESSYWSDVKKDFVANKEFDGNVKKFLSKRGITTGFLVTVDYHS